MLDSYVIERIHRERERQRRDGGFLPLHIEVPDEVDYPRPDGRPEREDERGSTVVDFEL